ncbi:GTPase-associated protein 1-related protein [Kitasatospora sp. NPDC008050]|uniref:GTPase-associated protein 1-related protein n=1 Tax=Kitasatospora sp. NPDC008050 TaxID=3364021 RepID=UPI0036EF2F60
MAFQQLYYTSCERGLSGFAGYQFNAVSPEVSTQAMREVEALTAYEPPRSLLYSQEPEELARCPVNLVFVPGEPALAARVRYAGRDSSQRFGNYFAHALSSPDFERDGGGLLGIELWEAPLWATGPVEHTGLPLLPARPEPGPLSPRSVGRFLRAHPHADRLPRLLAAALAALAQDRSVLVVDTSTEEIAHWFAAVCFLLPPPLARRLSFATYPHRPERGRLHLLGALPENRIELGPEQQDAYYLFDFVHGHCPDLPVPELVRLLARIGLPSARTLWGWIREYQGGEESRPEEWHGPVAAAAAAGGTLLHPADLAAVTGWLTGPAAALPAATVVTVLRNVHRQQQLDRDQLATFSRIAAASADHELAEQLLGEVYETDMLACRRGDPQAAAPVPLTHDPARRVRITQRWLTLFHQAEPVEALRLLGWAANADLCPPPPELVRRSAELTRRLLSATTSTGDAFAGLEDLLPAAARRWPEVRLGLVETLTNLAQGRDPLVPGVLSALPPGVLDETDLARQPELLEHFLVAQARRRPELAARALVRILRELRTQDTLELSLLHALWPDRHCWSLAEALRLVPDLPFDLRWDEGAHRWLTTTAQQPVTDQAALEGSLRLYELLAAPVRAGWLPPDLADCVERTLRVRDLLDEARSADGLTGLLSEHPDARWLPMQALLGRRLPARLAGRPVLDHREFAARLVHLEYGTAAAYLRQVEAAVLRVGPSRAADPVLISHLVAAGLALRYAPSAGLDALIRAIQQHAAQRWPAADAERFARELHAALPPPPSPPAAPAGATRPATVRGKVAGRVRGFLHPPAEPGPGPNPGPGSGPAPQPPTSTSKE